MSINISPKNMEVHVPYFDDIVILVLRQCSTEETFQYLKILKENEGKTISDPACYNARIEFLDSVLIDIKALNVEGNPESINFTDPETGEDKILNSQVSDWKNHINEIIKLRGLTGFEQEYFNAEPAKLKN